MKKTIDLSGEWKIYMGNAEEKMYADVEFNDVIMLPGTTSMAGKGRENDKYETGFLTDLHPYEGYCWYKKTLADLKGMGIGPDDRVFLYLERTRLTKVWVNGYFAGSNDSLTSPHVYDITDALHVSGTDGGKGTEITVQVANVGYPTKGGHLTSPDTQTNWNGIVGKIELEIMESVYVEKITVYPHVSSKGTFADVDIWLNNMGKEDEDRYVYLYYRILSKDSMAAAGDGEPKWSAGIKMPVAVKIPAGSKTCIELKFVPENPAELWSEYNTKVYELMAEVRNGENTEAENVGESLRTVFGFRDLSTRGRKFILNGKPIFLRGKHDAMIFPKTGVFPTDLDSWLKVFMISKSYGINHYRYHTCCPPEAAFFAADLAGIYMEPQLPFWGTILGKEDADYSEDVKKEQEYLIGQGRLMLETYGNHPSFMFMSMGNELWGSKTRISEIMAGYKKSDSRHLYTQGSNNFQFVPEILPEDDYFVGVRLSHDRLIRGSFAMCDAPLGFVQTTAPATVHDYNEIIAPGWENDGSLSETGSCLGKSHEKNEELNVTDNKEKEIEIQYGTGVKKVKASENDGEMSVKIPVVSHEIGQYAIFPDFKEIDKYTGVLKARNFEVFRDRLKEKGMSDEAADFFMASGKLSADCYKLELEAAAKTDLLSGFQLLDIQDYSGQGTALVGMLDAFMEPKGLISSNDWQGFCSDCMILAGLKSFIAGEDEALEVSVKLRNYNPKLADLKNAKVCYTLLKDSEELAGGYIDVPSNAYETVNLGKIRIELPGSMLFRNPDNPELKRPCWLKLKFVLVESADGNELPVTSLCGIGRDFISNEYELWTYPSHVCLKLTDGFEKHGLYITDSLSEARERLKSGGKVILIKKPEKKYVEGFYCTDFWNYPMFKSISLSINRPLPVGTMGLLIKNGHPILREFASKFYSTPQWYRIVTASNCAVLDDVTDKEYRPAVQMIDNFERCHKLGILFEGKVGNGRLIVSTTDFPGLMQNGTVNVNDFLKNAPPEFCWYFKSIADYAMSEEFRPDAELDFDKLSGIF